MTCMQFYDVNIGAMDNSRILTQASSRRGIRPFLGLERRL